MRHKVVHDYLGVDEDIVVWQVVITNLPTLVSLLEPLVPLRVSGQPEHHAPQHTLYFRPLPHGHSSFRPTFIFLR